jgi:hypothetical protein
VLDVLSRIICHVECAIALPLPDASSSSLLIGSTLSSVPPSSSTVPHLSQVLSSCLVLVLACLTHHSAIDPAGVALELQSTLAQQSQIPEIQHRTHFVATLVVALISPTDRRPAPSPSQKK